MRRSIVIALLFAASIARADDRLRTPCGSAARPGEAGTCDLARARELEARLEYEQALVLVDEMLARGGADPQRYVELQLFAGKLAAGLDRAQVAQDHYARALAVRPDAALPAGSSPKLTEPFAAAKARTQPLAVEVTVVRGLVTLAARDPLGLVAGIAVHVIDRGVHADLRERAARRIVIADTATPIEVAALDAAGNRLWVGPPPRIARPIEPVKPPRERRSVLVRWPTWAITGGVALAAAGVAAWRFTVAQDDFDRGRASGLDFTELEAIERRGRRWGLAANIGFGVTAAATIATAACLWRSPRDATRREVTIVPTGLGLGVHARF